MPKIADLVSSLEGGNWKLAGTGTPVEEVTTIPNPMASNPIAPANTPSTITQGTGRYYVVVQDPEGHQRAMFLTPSTDQGVTGPGLTPAPPITGKDQAPGTRVVAGNELAGLNWEQAGAIADVPAGATTKQPTPTAQQDRLDSQGRVIDADGNITLPDGTKQHAEAKQLHDNATGTTINLLPDPAGTLHDVGKEVWLVKPDGSHTVVGSVPADNKPSQFNVAGVGLVDYDPSKPDGQRTTVLIKTPDKTAPTTEVRNGKTYAYDNESKTWTETNLPAQADIGYTLNDPNSRYIKFYDKQGNQISQTDKGEDWKAPVQVQPGSAPAADTISPKILTLNPQTGAPEWTDNQNQVKASEATSELAKQLGVKVAAGSMSEKQAQDIITGAINTMNAQTSRMNAEAAKQNADTSKQTQISSTANDILTNARGNATTGAGMLNQRVQSATGALNSLISSAAGSKMTSIPGGVGQGLVQGLTDWTTQLGGGQAVYDTAARMVQAADPKISSDPTLANQAQQTLATMLQQYQDQTKQLHPLVQATLAAQQSTQNGGIVAPQTPTTVVPNQVQQQPQAIPTPTIAPLVSSGAVGPWAGGNTPPPGTTWQNPAFVAPAYA